MGLIGTAQLIDASSTINDQYFRTYSRDYKVYATTDFNEHDVRVNLGIAIGVPHVSDTGSLCTSVAVKLFAPNQAYYDSVANPGEAGPPPADGTACYVWLATVEWGPWNPQLHTSSGDPELQPIQVFVEGQTFEEPADVDTAGDPIVNSAFDYFDPPVVRDRTRPILRVIRQEDSFSASTILAYADKINSDAVGPYAEHTLKCSAPVGVPKYSQFTGSNYYEVTYILAYNPDTWDAKILDQGYNQLDPADATKRQKITIEGQPTQSPILLDGSGHALLPPVDHTDVTILTFQIYEEMSYATAFDFPSGTFT